MKFFRPEGAAAPVSSPSTRLDRRGLVAGAGVAGVAALAAAALTRRVAELPPVSAAKPARAAGEGYRETQHVLRYYETTRS
ncbi:MAG: formate dehydrogenase [Caldimonas sp.]